MHVFTYALLPHTGDWRAAHTHSEACKINQPIYARKGGDVGAFSLASTDRENAVLETIKMAEDGDGVILRVFENHNARTPVTMRVGLTSITRVVECSLMEENERELPFDGDTFRFTLNPYEIKTFRVI